MKQVTLRIESDAEYNLIVESAAEARQSINSYILTATIGKALADKKKKEMGK